MDDSLIKLRARLRDALSAPAHTDVARQNAESILDALDAYVCRLCEAHARLVPAPEPRSPALLSARQREGLATVLTRIGSWTNARWDQHLRFEVGDEDADAIVAWLAAREVFPYLPSPEDSRRKKDPRGPYHLRIAETRQVLCDMRPEHATPQWWSGGRTWNGKPVKRYEFDSVEAAVEFVRGASFVSDLYAICVCRVVPPIEEKLVDVRRIELEDPEGDPR